MSFAKKTFKKLTSLPVLGVASAVLLGGVLSVYGLEVRNSMDDVVQYISEVVVTTDGTDQGTELARFSDQEFFVQQGRLPNDSILEEDMAFTVQHPVQSPCPAGTVADILPSGVVQCMSLELDHFDTSLADYYQVDVKGTCPAGQTIIGLAPDGQVQCGAPVGKCDTGVFYFTGTNPLPETIPATETTYGCNCKNECYTFAGTFNLGKANCTSQYEVMQGFDNANEEVCLDQKESRKSKDCGVGNALQGFDGIDIECFNPDTASYAWSVGNWGSCSESCGGGTRTRSVVCVNAAGDPVADSSCMSQKPITSEVCNIQVCPCSSMSCIGTAPANTIVWSSSHTPSDPPTCSDKSYVFSLSNTPCGFYCDDGYDRNGSSCEPQNRIIACTAGPAYSVPNTTSTIQQARNGSNWTPSNTSTYNETPSTTECRFRCDTANNYEWNAATQTCVFGTIACGGTQPSTTIYELGPAMTSVGGKTWQQVPSTTTNLEDCQYKCKTATRGVNTWAGPCLDW